MPSKEKPYMRKLRRDEYRALHLFAASQGLDLESIAHNPMALEIPGSTYNDVFDVPIGVARLLGGLDGLYSTGYYIGYIDRGSFKPSLPLAHRLSRLCGHVIKCIKLSSDGEKFFLYGRRVLAANVIEWSPGLRIVVNAGGEALGWGVGVSGGMVEPLRDLGWYLRRGG